MIVTVGNTKGGVGKTTLAVQIALSRALAGRDVWLIDGDRQGTQYADGPVLRAQVQQQGRKFDDIVIDAGGRDSTALRAALVLSDVLVVPFQPRSVDVWALGDIASLVDEARSVRDGLRAYAVLNCADPGTASADNTDAAAALAEFPQLAHLDAPVRRRKAFANAVGQGLSVEEYSPRDGKACEELAALVRMVFANQDAMHSASR